jgi:hypothetical protein
VLLRELNKGGCRVMVEFPGKLFDNYNYYYYEAVAPEEEDLF